MTLCNNPRSIQFIREETMLIMAMPGPFEPSLEQMNELLHPVVASMKKLYNGESLDVALTIFPFLSHCIMFGGN
jgi:hypothetical protein